MRLMLKRVSIIRVQCVDKPVAFPDIEHDAGLVLVVEEHLHIREVQLSWERSAGRMTRQAPEETYPLENILPVPVVECITIISGMKLAVFNSKWLDSGSVVNRLVPPALHHLAKECGVMLCDLVKWLEIPMDLVVLVNDATVLAGKFVKLVVVIRRCSVCFEGVARACLLQCC